MNLICFLLLIIYCLISFCYTDEEFCYADTCSANSQRYLLYDVNGPEGFNLRRDVYMRFAVLAHKLQKSKNTQLSNFKLVLPPWSHLIHWTYSEKPEQIPWQTFFDIKSLQSFAPVIEMYDFFSAFDNNNKIVIDQVYILQHFEDMFETGNFEDRMKIDKCTRPSNLNYFFYNNITSNNVQCLSYHGSATKLSELLKNSTAKTILLHHAEVALHEMFGNKMYWNARRSMKFNRDLVNIANKYRKKYLNGTLDENRLLEDRKKRKTKGDPYLAVHLRRKDFLVGRAQQVPSLGNVIKQIIAKLKELSLSNVFIATDAVAEEYKLIEQELLAENLKPFRYAPSDKVKRTYSDGGAAIIDQIICSHATYFIGTYESTFSFRIQEEREILGFPIRTTFNCFCKDDNNCPQPSVWKIVW